MPHLCNMSGSNEIGVYAKLTDTYCLIGLDKLTSTRNIFEDKLKDVIPIITCSLLDCRIVGTLTAGNSYGLLVPENTKDYEIQHIRDKLPDKVKIQRTEALLSSLGNVIACNDHVAIVHPDIDKETEEMIRDVLCIEDIYKKPISDNLFVGSYCALSNRGCLVPPSTTIEDQKELSNLLEIPVAAGTVNKGSPIIGAGVIVNDFIGFCGEVTTLFEQKVMDSIFKLKDIQPGNVYQTFAYSFMDSVV